MKKKLYLVINCIFLLLLVFFNNSYASTTGTVYLSSDKKIIEKGEEIEISLSIENIKTAAFTAYLYFDNSKLEYISGTENTNVIENRIIYVWYDEKGGDSSKEGEIAKFKFQAKEDGTATFNIDGEFYSNVGQLIQTTFEGVQVQIGKEEQEIVNDTSNDNANMELANTNLEILAIENVLLNPAFDASITNYKAEISNETTSLNILAAPENEKGTVQITGKDSLKEGNNIVKITVTAQNGFSKKVYEVNVYRRNTEEENRYKEAQQINKKKLEEIYQADKMSNEIEKELREENKKENMIILIVIMIISTILLMVILIEKYRRKRKK